MAEDALNRSPVVRTTASRRQAALAMTFGGVRRRNASERSRHRQAPGLRSQPIVSQLRQADQVTSTSGGGTEGERAGKEERLCCRRDTAPSSATLYTRLRCTGELRDARLLRREVIKRPHAIRHAVRAFQCLMLPHLPPVFAGRAGSSVAARLQLEYTRDLKRGGCLE